MILYIDVIDNKLIAFGYAIDTEKKLNSTGPKKSFATKSGYNMKPIDPVIAKYYFYGIYINTPKQIEKLLLLKEWDKILILPNAIKLFNYLKYGQGINTYGDDQFEHPEKLKGMKNKIIPSPEVFLHEYVEELKSWSKIVPDEELNTMKIIEDRNLWRLKTDRPFYITGNTIVYYPDTNDYLCVSNGIDEKEYIKPNEIGRVITDINYTILDKETPMERIEALYRNIEPHNKLKTPVLFKSSTCYTPRVLRMLKSYSVLKHEGFYNMMQYSAMDDTTLAFMYMPPALLYKIKDEFTSIRKKILDEKGKWVDITEHFLENGKVKFKSDAVVKIKERDSVFTIKTNVDTFNRNRLKVLEKGAKLYLYLYETDKMFKYYTVLEHDGLTHISYAPFNNIVVK